MVLALSGSIEVKSQDEKVKKFDHYIGLQVNEFIRQIFNVTSQQFQHPYYINYAINFHDNGWGLNAGFGYDLGKTVEGDGITDVENEISALSFRIGPEKKFTMGKKFQSGVGVDFLVKDEYNKSTVTNNFESNQFTRTIVENSIDGMGGGVRLFLSWRPYNWLLLGTEASYYFLKSATEQRIEETISLVNDESQTTTTDDFEESALVFNTPTVLFVIISF